MFKLVMIYSDGTREPWDELCETEEDARAVGEEKVEAYTAGGEVLHLSNPGDYPLEEVEGDADFEVVEAND